MAVNTTTSCMSNMSGTVTVSVNAAPATYTVTGGGNYCTGGTGVHIGLTGSTAGINYTVVGTGVTAAGTGAALDFGLFTSATSYTVNAVNPATGCAADMTGSVSVSISPLPAVYTVTGGGSYCASTSGVAVGLSSSDLGINYQLYNGTSTVGGPVAGVGGPLNFGLHTAGTYTVVAINATTTCTRNMTGTATVTVLPSVVPSVTVVSGAGDTVCTGTSVTFTALPVNGGSLPGYQWSVNGAIVTGATTNNYTYVPANGNVVGVTLTSSATCPLPATASGSVTMTVRANVLPTVAITANPGNNVCQGTTVDLMATTTFGGIAPSFSWKVNGAPSGSGSTFSYIPMDGDVVFAVMTSSYQCVSALSVLSNNISFTTQSNVAPTVTLTMTSGTNSGNILYNDTVVAAVVNGGSNPVYQWTVNGVVVPGATTAVLYRSTLNDMDVVSCQVADSNACGYLVGAGSITVHSSNVGVTPVPAATASDMHLMPNPNKGTFTIRGTLASTEDQDVTIEVTDVLGQVIYANRVATHNGVIEEKVQMTTTLANGMYMVSIRSANESKVFHMVVEQ